MKFDTTRFVAATIKEIGVSLALTLLAVVVVVSLFLQSWRATLIVVLAIPVSLIGTFAVLYLLGYSANTLSLFAIILALTMVVDDAIVVVENVETKMAEGLDRLQATARGAAADRRAGNRHDPGAAGGVCAGGAAPGDRRRAVPAVCRDALHRGGPVEPRVALTLTPALCALLLRPRPARPAAVWRAFNRLLDGTRDGYGRLVGRMNRRPSAGAGGDGGGRRAGGVQLHLDAERLPAAGRSGLPVCQRAAAGGGVAGAYRSGDGPRRASC